MSKTPLKVYWRRVEAGELVLDHEQERVALALQRLFDLLLVVSSKACVSFFHRMLRRGTREECRVPDGLYIYGGVGRGKSMLMDLFYETLPEGIGKRRVHFHEFMIEVHDYIHSHQADGSVMGAVDQALPSLAGLIARRSRVLCFDEFHVSDIADAMILGRLFKILFEHDVVVVATSNWPPDDLYKDGLQRERFLPFIDLLKSKVCVFCLEGNQDYRRQKACAQGTYFTPLGKMSDDKMDRIFEILSDGEPPENDIIHVKGREIVVEQTARGAGRFSFSQLCEGAYGAEDYIAIADRFHSLMIEGIPIMGREHDNEAKRFMTLIDVLYEAGTRVFFTAEDAPDHLYQGSRYIKEFERTVSRLLEMQQGDAAG
ncbi:MAG: cell division protein ZapE [Alphaproteobacteria bacterium]